MGWKLKTATDMSLRRHSFLKSLAFALQGIRRLLREERNARIHLAATMVVLFVSAALSISRADWLWIGLSITLVWLAELFNSAIERLTDLSSPDPHPLAGAAKDFAAGGVLVAALFSLFTAALVLFPYLQELVF